MPAELSPPIVSSPDKEEEQLDPELISLPDPPRRERTWTLALLALTAFASLAMAVALRGDAKYAFASPMATDLGDLRDAPATALVDNAFVRAHAMLGAAGAIRYERPFDEGSYRLSPVAGRRDVWVDVRVPAGQENARYVPPSSFSGRLVHLDAAGLRHRGLAAAIARATGEAAPRDAWLLVDGEPPNDARWAVALIALFAAFALWNVGAIVRLARRVR
jgi:hypothetical protein